MKNIKLLLVATMVAFLLTGCGISNETAQAIALKALDEGGKILLYDHVLEGDLMGSHIFVGKTANGQVVYIRIRGEKIVKFLREK